MPRRTYSRQDSQLLDALLVLIASCMAHVERETRTAEEGLPNHLRARLKGLSKEAVALGILAQLITDRPRREEQSSIRSGRSENNAKICSKAISISADEEQPPSHSMIVKEVPLTDLLLFPDHRSPPAAVRVAHCWPRLEDLTFTSERLDARNRGIGGSDANIILSGDQERIVRLWREKRGESPPVDLSGKLSVVLGSWTEALNRQWFEKLSGERVTDVGFEMECAENGWRKCTLDGVVDSTGAVFEAKHTNAFAKADEVLERYMPQLQHNMAVLRTDRAVLSVIFGNARYEMFEVAWDWLYQRELLAAEKAFWSAVLSGEQPGVVTAPAAPLPIATRELSFDGNNAWAAAAADWLQHGPAARLHAAACKTLKELIDDDVKRAFGHGIEARRSRSGAVTIRPVR